MKAHCFIVGYFAYTLFYLRHIYIFLTLIFNWCLKFFLYIALLILTNLHNLRIIFTQTQSRTGQTSVHPRALLIYNHEFMLDETERTRGNIIYYFVIHKYVIYTATHFKKKSVNKQITIKRSISCKSNFKN